MSASVTPDTCKAIMEYAAIKVAIDNLSQIGPKKSMLLGNTVIVNLLKLLKMILNALVV